MSMLRGGPKARSLVAALRCSGSRQQTQQQRLLSSSVKLQRGQGSQALQVGETYHNFTLQRVADVPEYGIKALELQHGPTKAHYLHIDAKDTNNVFSVCFRTPPASSNGIAHILEHTTLCGSEKFPVRDPFFNMIKRSLNTYMNALTGSDHTMYPFSTTNAQDWNNLRDVYLDAVFFPNLRRNDFLQEGHRVEIAPTEDGENECELVYKGVVLNEMKGVMSDSNNLFSTKLQQALLDGTIYGHVSGGDPDAIPELTYDELRAFHAKHYHPSNCCFYSYGDLPLTDHLQYLDEQILHRFEYRPDSAATRVDTPGFDISVKTQESKLQVVDGPAANMSGESDDASTKFCVSKLVDISPTDPFETFVMRIVSYLLTNGPSSPLYKALIDSKLAQDFAVGTGFDTSTYYCTFGVGVEGIEGGEASLPKIEQAVQAAYAQVVAEGFEKERVDGLLHQLELSLKHIVGNFGLTLMHGAASVWTHRGDLIENLQLNPVLSRLEQEMEKNPRFLESYIEKHLMTNETKQVRMLMKPKESYVEDRDLRERQKLEAMLCELSPKDLDRIAATAQRLEKHQQEPQPVDCLPTLTLADIPVVQEANFDSVDHQTLLNGRVGVEYVNVPTTNEMSYMRLMFNTTGVLPVDAHVYIPLLTSLIGALGTSKLRYDVLPTVIQNCSGGISCSAISNPSLVDAHGSSQQAVLLGSLCLPHKIDATLDVMAQLLTDTQFLAPENLAQLRILLQMGASSGSQSISSTGARLAAARGRLGITHTATYQELYGGLTQIEQLQKWAQCSDDELFALAQTLQQLARLVFNPANLRLSVVTEANLRDQMSRSLESHLLEPLEAFASSVSVSSADLSASSSFVPVAPPTLEASKSYFGFPISVNFVVETLPTVSFAHADHVPLTVLTQMMSSCFLHQQVREQGGAYGSAVSQGEGSLSLSSHYDPNTWKTLSAYEQAKLWAVDGKFSDRDIHEALLSIFASIDAPKTPAVQGNMSFLRGITNDMRQQRREQYLALGRQDLVAVALRTFGENDKAPKPSNVVIIGKETTMAEFEAKGFATRTFAQQ